MTKKRRSLFSFILSSLLILILAGCNGGSNGVELPGGDAGVDIAEADVQFLSGLVSGGVTNEATQTMRGILPSPNGTLATVDGAYDGTVYLVVNGQRIQVNVTPQAVQALAQMGQDEGVVQGQTITKGGVEYPLAPKSAFPTQMEKDGEGEYQWVYEVTFSLNAGPNTVQIQVYDLNDTLYAQSDQWTYLCAIEPSGMTVTLSWDTNLTDIDLWVANVDDDGTVLGEPCGWSHSVAADGDGDVLKLDYDDVNGYGPEHITLDNASRTKKYAVKVFYYADHNPDEDAEGNPLPITATTAYVTAEANGEVKLTESNTLSAETSAGSWTSAGGWDVGTFEVEAPARFGVDVQNIDTSNFPEVALTVHVTDPNNAEEPNVTDLAQSNFYVINAGKAMSPVTMAGGAGGIYTLTYKDITCGKRDLYVYVYVPAEGDELMKSGLSETKTYGKNYALLVGLNEYPPAACPTSGAGWVDGDTIYVDCTPKTYGLPSGTPISAADFTITCSREGQASASVSGSTISDQGGGVYRINFNLPAAYQSGTGTFSYGVKYKYQSWLLNSVNDITDMKNVLIAKGTGFSNSSWDAENIYTLTNAAATKSAIIDKIEDIALDMNIDGCDLFLFHYSGHGSGDPADGEDAQYLCAYEDDKWVSVNDLEDALWTLPEPGDLTSPSNLTNIFVFIDACHSGNFIGKDIEMVAQGAGIPKYREFLPQADTTPGSGASFVKGLHDDEDLKTHTFVITAVEGSETALDVRALNNGLFTYYLTQGMSVSGINGSAGTTVSSAPSNTNNDSWVTGEEAYIYCKPKSEAYNATKIPQMYDNSTDTISRLIYNW